MGYSKFLNPIHNNPNPCYHRYRKEMMILTEYAYVMDSLGVYLDPTDKKTAEKLLREEKADIISCWPMKIQLRYPVANPNSDSKYPLPSKHGFTYLQRGAKHKKVINIASAGELPPEVNRFVSVSQYHKKSVNLAALPPAKNFRSRFTNFLGCFITVECSNWTIIPSKVDHLSCDRILLVDAMIVECPKRKEFNLPFRIQHVWTAVDCGWKNRIKPKPLSPLLLRGEVALYARNGFKNVGFFVSEASIKEGVMWIS